MTSSKPYLLRALFDWIIDNDLTPNIIVDAERVDVELPAQSVRDLLGQPSVDRLHGQ